MNPTKLKSFLVIVVLAFACVAFVEFEKASELELVCRGMHDVNFSSGRLGRRVARIERNRLYQMFDPILSGVVFVLSDSNGNVIPKPLAAGSVFECSFASVSSSSSEAKMCQLEDGRFTPLKKGDPKAITRSIIRLAYTGDWNGRSLLNGFEWEHGKEIRLGKRNPKAIQKMVLNKKRKLANEIIVPGSSVPKFYRKNDEYWGQVNGDNFPIRKGHWMQLFRDGNYHLVKLKHHLEEWPGESSVVVEVPDFEDWIKIGKGSGAFVLAERPLGRRTNWSKYYRKRRRRPANPRVSALSVCSACEEQK